MQNYAPYKELLKSSTYEVLQKANDFSDNLLSKASHIIDEYFVINKLKKEDFCFVVIGSLGRFEALESSDIDLIPVCISDLDSFLPHDKPLRQYLEHGLEVHVSEGHDLTKAISITDLLKAENIGGEDDSSETLTKRILILTEGVQVYGEFPLHEVQRKIMELYADSECTRGRHILSLCNDIVRYYRTLCIEYKAKIDIHDKGWGSRNMKLRHSRKMWYFSCIMCIVFKANEHHSDTDKYKESLLDLFKVNPISRILQSINDENRITVGEILYYYTTFLNFMSSHENRKHLDSIDHSHRYDQGSLFTEVKLNSDLLHLKIRELIFHLPPTILQKVFDWFLL